MYNRKSGHPELWAAYTLTLLEANLLVNAAIEDHSIDDLGIVVFDELHMLEDESRGYILEVLATKLLCLESIPVQIVGMSATLSVGTPRGITLNAPNVAYRMSRQSQHGSRPTSTSALFDQCR